MKRVRLIWSDLMGTFQSDDFAGRVHDGAVCRDRPADRVARVAQVHDQHLVLLTHLLSDADEAVRLHGQAAEADAGRTHSQRLQLERDSAQKHTTELHLFLLADPTTPMQSLIVL